MQLIVGTLAESTDGVCGDVIDIVVDPVHWRVTHLVVQPHHRHDRPRLIPVGAVTSTAADRVALSWSTAQIERAAPVDIDDFVSHDSWPELDGGWDAGVERVLGWPCRSSAGCDGGGHGYPYGYGTGLSWSGPPIATITYGRIPRGTIDVRRASRVLGSDGREVGRVDGFVIDATAKVTHVVLERGHLWGSREIAVPIADIDHASSDVVQLAVTAAAVGEYRSVPFHRRAVRH